MFINVKILNRGELKELTYRAPEGWPSDLVGRIVKVPLKESIVRGLICGVVEQLEGYSYTMREAIGLESIPQDPLYTSFIARVGEYYAVHPAVLCRGIWVSPERGAASSGDQGAQEPTWHLTAEQERVVAGVRPALVEPRYQPALLHGVTGSGKTAVYSALVREAFACHKSVIILLPEISIAIAVAQALRALCGASIPIYEWHTMTPTAQRAQLWHALMAGAPVVVVGVHIPVLAPMSRLGLIIVDEEHESGFQDTMNYPHINARDVALMRAHYYQLPILLGSATPSLNALHAVERRGWHYYALTHRFAGAFPKIRHIILKPQLRHERATLPEAFWISEELREAMRRALGCQEQVIIFLNRRGLHRFVQCKACGYIFVCTACSVSVTLHSNGLLICHYCARERVVPEECSSCHAPAAQFLKKGIGTQRMATLLQQLFPGARIARADADTARARKVWQATVAAMQAGTIDILVGTQTITKGFHFPRVTVVGVVWAESNLMVPFYTAAERTLQQILQVAGRAGRASDHSEVIVQSSITHPLFNYLDEARYRDFCRAEYLRRAEPAYPPHVRLSEIELSNEDEAALERDAQIAAASIRFYLAQRNYAMTVLGPALPPVDRIEQVHFRKIYLKGASIAPHIGIFHAVRDRLRTLESTTCCWFTPNPVQ